jgi:UDP-N-acetylglucosamine 1-carboxyvinyltransferase
MFSMEDKPINSLTNAPITSITEKSVLHIWGQNPLAGEVQISGAKNSALVLMAGAILCSGECRINNIPALADVGKMCQIIEALGIKVRCQGNTIDFDAREVTGCSAPYELVSKLRAAFFAVGPILARQGEAQVPLPGGCSIGDRPVELHIRGLQALGATVEIKHGEVYAKATSPNGRLQGAKIYLDYPSVGATETLMMAATLAEGETVIDNAAKEPEVVDLANFCIAMGAVIAGAGTERIVIQGVDKLHSVEYDVIPDRVEAATFLVAGAMTRSEISLFPVIPMHLAAALAKLAEIGVEVEIEGPRMRVLPPKSLKAVNIETLPYPAFPTDMQAQFMALLAVSEGNSVITETVFENRLQHVAELQRMGANIQVKGNHAIIQGVAKLSGAKVMATDLRASAALVIAGLYAEGMTTVEGLHHLDRGYENIEQKLRSLGANIERVIVDESGRVLRSAQSAVAA